jgi:hypothetical protein
MSTHRTAEEVVQLNKDYTLFEWNAQAGYSPMSIEQGAENLLFCIASRKMKFYVAHGEHRFSGKTHVTTHQD